MTDPGFAPNARDDMNLPPCDMEPAHVCLPLYRADDGKPTRCWCGRDCRDDKLHDLQARLTESLRMIDGASNVVELAAARRKRGQA